MITVLNVTQLNEYVRKSLAMDPMLQDICLQGEVCNLKMHISGHWYFSLKDDKSTINVAMFRQNASCVSFTPKNGMLVKTLGSVGLYSKTGSFQFYITHMEKAGVGDAHQSLEELKNKLINEGLFDISLKKALPLLPKGIVVVTSKTGAVIHDIAQISWRRNPSMPIYLCSVSVQGENSVNEIIKGISIADNCSYADVIIVGRGGGSSEDLSAFNDEKVVRAIAKCKKPVISAVGHETDITLSDFVADVRAATPSAAAEIAVQPISQLKSILERIKNRIHISFNFTVEQNSTRLLTILKEIEKNSPLQKQIDMQNSLLLLRERISYIIKQDLEKRENNFKQLMLKIKLSSPINTLNRGYAIIKNKNTTVQSVKNIKIGQALDIRLIDGQINATVTSTTQE